MSEMYDIRRKMRLHIYGAYDEAAEAAYIKGYQEALQDVRTMMGGMSPVNPEQHKERAELLDKLDLNIMQKLYQQISPIDWYMKQRESRKREINNDE